MAKSRAQDLPEVACPSCGEMFKPYRTHQRACSRKCREALGPPDPSAEYVMPVPYACRRCGVASVGYSAGGGGKFYYCDTCRPGAIADAQQRKNEARARRWAEDPEWREHAKSVSRRSRYGISREQYEQMLQQQQGRCAICGDAPNPNGSGPSTRRLHVDHDHSTGRVRQLLCSPCNRALGYLKDDPAVVRAALKYLVKFKS